MAKYKGELQTDNGDILYPHTSADVVFDTDGKSISERLKWVLENREFLKTTDDINNFTHGVYKWGEPPINAPYPWGEMLAYENRGYITQIIVSMSDRNNIAVRTRDDTGTWLIKHIVNKDQLPTSLPANGGNADTVDNKHASDFVPVNGVNGLHTLKNPTTDVALSINTASATEINFEAIQASAGANKKNIHMCQWGGQFLVNKRNVLNDIDARLPKVNSLSPPASVTNPDSYQYLFYKASQENFAGFGIDGGGGIHLRTGTANSSAIDYKFHDGDIYINGTGLKQSVVSGKQQVATAIDGKLGYTSGLNGNSTHADLAWWINNKIKNVNVSKLGSGYSPQIRMPMKKLTTTGAPPTYVATWSGTMLLIKSYNSSQTPGMTLTFTGGVLYANNLDDRYYNEVTSGRYFSAEGNSCIIFNPNGLSVNIDASSSGGLEVCEIII